MNSHSIVELNEESIDLISGGSSNIDWGAVGAGAAFIGISIAVAATPVGWVGAGFAAVSAFGGGFAVGTGAGGFFMDEIGW